MNKFALIVLAGASLLGTGIASAQYSFGFGSGEAVNMACPAIIPDGAPNIRVLGVAVAPIAASSPLSSVEQP
jgi:hypothetical protein